VKRGRSGSQLTTIGFIRHGSTAWNEENRKQGRQDIALSELGKAQAEALARSLSAGSWDAIISSDLQRAHETAQRISGRCGIPIARLDSRLREISWGQLEGTTEEERIARWGEHWRSVTESDIEEERLVVERGMSALRDCLVEYPDRRVLIVSHAGILRLMLRHMLKLDHLDPIENASLNIVRTNGLIWELI